MKAIRIIRAGSLREAGWKNGGGTTREIAIFPPDAGMHDFGWRLSMATVATAGAFSVFPDIDRTLAVLEGTLHLSSTAFSVELDEAADPFSFDGGLALDARPLPGPVLDINAMVRRGRFRAKMARLNGGEWLVGRSPTFLMALEPLQLCGESCARFDIVEVDGSMPVAGRCLAINFSSDGLG